MVVRPTTLVAGSLTGLNCPLGLPLLNTEPSSQKSYELRHNGPMEQVSTVTSSRPRGIDAAASALKQAADSRAAALASTIRELMATGFVSQCALADELNLRKIPTARSGSWHRTTVARVLIRLGLITSGQGNNGLAIRQIADARAEALGPTIRELRKAGFVSSLAIARELNERRDTNGTWLQMAPNQR